MMTKRERAAKNQVMRKLFEAGYGSNSNTAGKITYAELFDHFDLHLTKDPSTVAYVMFDKAIITVNENLDIDQVQFIVRHEILHEYLDHWIRFKRHLGVDDDQAMNILAQDRMLQNIAADLELSNRGYTDADKKIAKAIRIGDKVVQGLVTDIDHPDWVDLSMEQMYDKLKEQSDEYKEKLQQMLENNPRLDKPGDQDMQDLEDLERTAQSLEEIAEEYDKEAQRQSGSGSGNEEGTEGEEADGEGRQDGQEQAGDGDSESQSDAGGNEEESQSKSTSQQLRDRAKQLRDLAEKLKNATEEAKEQIKQEMEEDEIEPLRTPEEVADDARLQGEIQELKNLTSSPKAKQDILDKVKSDINAQEMKKASKEAEKYRKNPLNNFRLELDKLIKNEIALQRGSTWKRFNKTYVGTGLIRPGITTMDQKNIPSFNMYFDQSGSWTDQDIEWGKKAVATVNEYVRKGQIKLNLFYFSNHVHIEAENARAEGGTCGQPILDHIQKTNPTNVIVMTDSDISDCRSNVSVPGGVFFLFNNGISDNLMAHLSGDLVTKSFMINTKDKI